VRPRKSLKHGKRIKDRRRGGEPNSVYIDFTKDEGLIKVHLQSARDLEQIPGEIEVFPHGKEYREVRKTFEGVQFFYLEKAVSEMKESA